MSRKVVRELEEEVMDVQRELDEGQNAQFERGDPWLEPKAYKKKLFDEKQIIKAVVVGILTAQIWNDDFFAMPEGFSDTIQNISQHVQLLRFSDPKSGHIRMSINDIVDRHMRLWLQTDENCQKWVEAKLMDTNCILRAACDVLQYERRTFEFHFKSTLREAKREIAEGNISVPPEALAPKEKKQAPKPESKSPSSGFLPAVQLP